MVGHIVDSYCLGFKRGVIHIVVLCYIVNDHYLKSFMSLGLVILSTAAAWDLTEEWFILWFVRLSTTTSAVVRGAVCHIIDKYFLRLERGVLCVVNVGYNLDNYYLMFDCRVICAVSNCCTVDFCSIFLHFMEKFKSHVGKNPSTWRKSTMFCKLITRSIT